MWAPWLDNLLAPARWLLEAAYPDTCALCGAFCEGEGFLCVGCRSKLEELEHSPACPRCARPAAEAGSPCPWCQGQGVRPYQGVISLGVYAEPLKGLIRQLKYHGRWALAEELGQRMMQQERVREALAWAEVIVPAPLHIKRRWLRGFNQSELIARHLAAHCGARLLQPLRRVRDTASQTTQTSQKARRDNVRGAFLLRSDRGIEGRRVLVVDDVTTSSSTLREAGRQLLRAAPAGLRAIVLAVGDPRGRDFERI